VLIGRTTELEAVAGALDGLASGSPFVLAFAGDEGSGRSSLLDAATKQARAAGAMVLAARGSGIEPGPAYSSLLALLRPLEPLLDELAAPEHVAAVQSALAIRNDPVDAVDVGVGVLRVLAGAAESRPVVLVLDDAAAIDTASATSIAFALARVGVDPIGAFVGMPTSPSAWDDVVTRRVVLGPLGVSDLVAIVQHATDCGPDAARACAEWAGGSPMLAVELASSLSDDERSGRVPLPRVPRATVRAVERLQQGLDALSERARRALVVAAASRSERVSVILRALDALGEPPGGLDEAEDAGHVALGGGAASFTHPLLEPLSYHLVAASSRRAAHRALAGALVEPRDAVERAWHLAESCVGPDEDVAAALDLVAADARRRGALIESAATLERGAALSPEPKSAAARRRAAAVAALDGFDFDAALRLVDPADPDDEEAAWLAIEAVERRDGESAALGALATRPESPADVLADLLVGTGRRADAAKELEAAPDTPLAAAVRAVLDPASPLPEEPAAIGAIGRRARRRWLQAASARGHAVANPTSVDELVGAAQAAGSRGDAVAARDLVERALATVPKSATRLLDSLRAVATRFDEVAVTASSVPSAVFETLTKAERRVAESVAAGRTNKEVADHLFVSVKTVDFHLQGIYRKLSVRSRTELAVLMAPTLTGGGSGTASASGVAP
jgi:DNA-binding NarL/FixJ family response regulator